jgi:adenylosuccinate lyase
VALAHSYLALQQTMKGLERMDLDREGCLAEVNAHPEVLAEAIQTILRAEGVDNAYDLLKTLTRGHALSMDDLHTWIDGLDLQDAVKVRLRALTPTGYIGLAQDICERVVRDARAWLNN